ncbi:hypothetical protein ARTSIC4J27_230 [Pseudarthrobacter siccitolerans]|uniref:Minor tail protein n=1 Tax=Pseudarthrobacter siccitolerans TaxID=861266 RepID=A0A024GXU9_9MICC|nr:hypothetical protein [Pseudarthrobacter siccitolerans]CCQ44306.1 hypothetical protein ARTSIC4J27_230 [Pseudarthrobacter siccitolerans]
MTVNRGLFVRNNGAVGTTPIEGRLVLASLVAENAPGVPRQGLLDQKATTVVSGTTATSPLSYSVAPCTVVLNRATNEGVYLFTLTGTTTVTTTAAPSTGARWDLIYVKQNDPDKGDANNSAVLGVHSGTAAVSPTKPTATLPAGAYVLAEALVSAGATSTSHANVTITQTWRYTAHRGHWIPVRSQAERDEITPQRDVSVRRLDQGVGVVETWNGTAWDLGIRHVEFVRLGQTDAPAGVMWGPGHFSAMIDPGPSRNYADWLEYPGNDLVRITKEGLYAVQWKIVPATQNMMWFGVGTSPQDVYQGPYGRVPAFNIPGNDSYWTPLTNFYVGPAGQQLCFQFSSGNANVYMNHRIKITKLG